MRWRWISRGWVCKDVDGCYEGDRAVEEKEKMQKEDMVRGAGSIYKGKWEGWGTSRRLGHQVRRLGLSRRVRR
jgi:hypothetical protein